MAFAAVISLKHTIERLSNPEIAESVYEELHSLAYTLRRLDHRNYRSIERSTINALDAEIREAVYKLEDLLQSYPSDLTPLENNGVDPEIDLILTRVKKLRSNYNRELDNPLPGLEDEVVSPIDVSGPKKSTAVWLSDQLKGIRNQLLDGTLGLKTVSLVGMAGIGKTHLALQVYQDPLIVQEFEFRAWVSVGQKDQIKKVLADIVAQIKGEPVDQYIKMSIWELRNILETCLTGRRYLIVLDDMWSTRVYNALIRWRKGETDLTNNKTRRSS